MTGRHCMSKWRKDDSTVDMVLAFLGVWREEKGQWHFPRLAIGQTSGSCAQTAK